MIAVYELTPELFSKATEIVQSGAPTIEQIERLEDEIAEHEQVDCPLTHRHAPGLYAREMFIPAGTVATGKLHKDGHLFIILSGTITIWTEDGMKKLSAPHTLVSQPGAKRVAYAHTDVVLMTVHHSFETDLVVLEAELIIPTRQIGTRQQELLT